MTPGAGLPDDLETRYHRDGFVLVTRLLPSSSVSALEEWVSQIAALPNPPPELSRYYEEDGRRLKQIENACAVHPALQAFALSAALLQPVARLFGEPARLFKDKINFKLAGGAGYPAHRDGRFWWTTPDGRRMPGWDVYGRDFLSVLISIDGSTMENGCLELAPGRHRREDLGEDYGPLTEDDAAAMTFEPCPTAPGDVIFFNALAPHRSGPNLSTEPRRVLYLTYHPASDGDQRARYFEDKQRSIAAGAANR